jgi:2-dehydropantoate 2-reductase
MKIAVVGAGGVGGYFGGRLAQHGEDVTFIARGAHLQGMRERGLRVTSHYGDFTIDPVQATDNPAEVGPVDIVMIAVKMWDVEAAAQQIGPLLGDDTGVISFQNGVDAEEMLAAHLGRKHVVGGVAYVFATITDPGCIAQNGAVARLVVGELDGRPSARTSAFTDASRAAGIDITLSDDIEKDLWTKFAWICGVSGMTTLTRSSMGPIREDPDTRELFVACIREVEAVGRTKGVRLDPDVVERHVAAADNLPTSARSSMAADLERGNRLEVHWLNGTVARLGKELGVETPVNRFVYAALKLHAEGAP